ncbi:MAG: glycosyltransferase [Candidatus Marinimicrobia bacterium]|jgi:trehalose synthase|nr:glycosyltransferase [Candidatus Neomarinimicrobiota bacterium]
MKTVNDYREIVGDKIISDLYKKSRKLSGKSVVHINSTYYGGGVAEILSSLVPLMNDVGLDAGWRTLRGSPDVFSITKKFHNALQGDSIHLTSIKKKLYTKTNEDFSTYTHLNHDFVIIHDPQPLPLIKFYKRKQPWIWRCHIDLSHPNKKLWHFLKGFILQYDGVIISHESYRNNIPFEEKIISPVIDPLTPKNMDLSEGTINKYLHKYKIPTDKPLVTQISRFDKWKDPIGVINTFKLVKEKVDCRLILCGSMAGDDPEGIEIFENVKRKANNLIEKGDVILLNFDNNILVNILQRISDVIIQKSIREGFGLTITEALWKETPVVASNVGGIPLQITDGEDGFLFEPNDLDGFAKKIIEILKDPEAYKEVGKKGKEKVRNNFLITRLLGDYLDLLNETLDCR